MCLSVIPITPQDLDQQRGTIKFYDRKTRRSRLAIQASDNLFKVLGVARSVAMRLGREAAGPMVGGGALWLQAILRQLLQGSEFSEVHLHT